MESSKGSRFSDVTKLPPNAIFNLTTQFNADPSPDKVNLGVGAYRDADLKPYVFPAVAKAEKDLLSENHEYSKIVGDPDVRWLAAELALGPDSPAVTESRVSSIQTVGGTGALRIAFELVLKTGGKDVAIAIPTPTWGNHPDLLTDAGFPSSRVLRYQYWDPESRGLAMPSVLASLEDLPTGSAVLLHACAHNPTGVDPTVEQWDAILSLAGRRGLLIVFDMAYQGFATGDAARDAYPVREAARLGLEFFLAQSFSKNFGLYGERVGCLHLVTGSGSASEALLSVAAVVARRQYSNPPIHGAGIVAKVLGDVELKALWTDNLRGVVDRITSMRRRLRDELEKAGAPGDWSHITNQIGMFSFTGLSKSAVQRLTADFHIYMLSNGRISLAGLNDDSCVYVAKAIASVLKDCGPAESEGVGGASSSSSAGAGAGCGAPTSET